MLNSADSIYATTGAYTLMDVQYVNSASGISSGLITSLALGVVSTSTTNTASTTATGTTTPSTASSTSSVAEVMLVIDHFGFGKNLDIGLFILDMLLGVDNSF
jgi:hypothetical protein